MIFAPFLLIVAATAETTAVQNQVDNIVSRCEAQHEISFIALGGRQVELRLLTRSEELTLEQKRHLDCVFESLKLMSDLSFGFVGNEESPSGS